MKYIFLSTALAITPVVSSAGQVEFVLDATTTLDCAASSIEFTSQGVLRVLCGEATDPPPTDPPPTDPPPTDTYLGQKEDGTWVTEAQELAGNVRTTLFIPSLDDYDTVVYEGGNSETVYPGCAGIKITGQREWRECKDTGTLEPGITYVQRLPVTDTLPEGRIEMATTETGDRLGNYDYSVSNYPGDLDPEDALCKSKNTPGATFYFQSWACIEPLQNLDNGMLKMYYANFRAAGPNASKCGGQLTCRMYLRSW